MAIFPFSVDSVRIGTANITASGSNIVLPAGTQVGNQPVATVVEVSTGGGPKITNLQITDNAWAVLDDTAVDTAGGYVLITGTNFVSGALVYFNQTAANSVAFVSATTLRVTVPALTAGTYIVYVINPDGGTAIRVPGLTASANPAWQTGSALPEQYDGVAITLNLVATDATSYTVTSGSLPPGLSLNANTGVITGTVTGVTVDTLYTFTVRATDAQNQDSPRTFTVTIVVSDPYFRLTTLLLSGSAISANTVVKDSSTNNFNLTVFGDARASNFTPYGTGWSNYFDGSGDWLVTSNVGTTTGDFTLELWCYLDSSQPQGWYPYVFGTNSPWQGSGGIGLAYNTQSGVADGTPLYFNVAGGGITVDTHSNLKSRWVHLALTRSGSTIRAFLNGTVLATTLTNSSTINTSTFMIGGVDEGGSYGNHAMKCWISNFRFVKDSALYTANFTPATSSLTSITNTALLICQSNRFVDNSANNYSLSRSGDVKIDGFNPFNITNTGTDGSMYFDGTGDYCTTSGNAAFALGTGDFCLETWIYPNSISTGTFDRIVATSDYNGAGFDWTLNTASSSLYVAGTAYSISNLVIRSWNHLVYTRSSGVLRGFLNGNLAVYNASSTTNVTSTGELRIGTGYSGTAYNGYISNLRIVKGSIPAAYQTSSTTINTTVFSPPTTLLTAVTGTSLLTLQYDQPHNNHAFLDSSSNQFVVNRAGNASQGTFSPFSLNGWSNFYNSTQTNWPDTTWNTLAGITFTIECWLYPTANGGVYNGMILGNNVSGRGDATWFYFSETAKVGIGTAGSTNWTSFGSTNSVPLNSWSHVAITIDGPSGSATAKIYINGVLDSTHLNRSTNIPTNIGNCLTGTRGDGSQYNYYGYISDLRITKNQVLYTGNFTPPTAQLTTVSVGTSGPNVAASITGTVSAILYSNARLVNAVGNTKPDSNSSTVQSFSPFAATAIYNPTTHGGSVYYDASGDSVTVPSNSLFSFPGDFCIEAWVYPSAAHTIAMKYVGGDVGNSEWYFAIDGTFQLSIALDGGGSEDYFRTATNTITPYAWNHCVATRSGTAVRLFINGVLRSYNTTSKTLNTTGTQVFMNGNSSYQAGFMITRGAIPALYQTANTTSGTAIFTPPSTVPASTANTSILLNYSDAAILDNTGRQVLETVADAKSTSVVTKFTGGSMYFDGTGDYVKITPNYLTGIGTADFTIEGWWYFLDFTTRTTYFQRFWSFGTGLANHVTLNIDNSGYPVYRNNDSPLITSSAALSLSTWTHVALVRYNGTTRIYINGTDRGNTTTNNDLSSRATNIFYIGSESDGAGGYFYGYVSDLRITRYARYTANFTAPTAPARLK